MGGRMYGRMDAWMDGRMDGWMESPQLALVCPLYFAIHALPSVITQQPQHKQPQHKQPQHKQPQPNQPPPHPHPPPTRTGSASSNWWTRRASSSSPCRGSTCSSRWRGSKRRSCAGGWRHPRRPPTRSERGARCVSACAHERGGVGVRFASRRVVTPLVKKPAVRPM